MFRDMLENLRFCTPSSRVSRLPTRLFSVRDVFRVDNPAGRLYNSSQVRGSLLLMIMVNTVMLQTRFTRFRRSRVAIERASWRLQQDPTQGNCSKCIIRA